MTKNVRYIGTKLLRAYRMTRGGYNDLRGWETPADENHDDPGYLVEYLDGGKPNHKDFDHYISWSPADVFERAYRPLDGMTFGLAIEALKMGKKVARRGWSGKGMWLYMVPAAHYAAQTTAAAEFFGPLVPYRAYVAMKTANDEVVPWTIAMSDMLEEDWELIP